MSRYKDDTPPTRYITPEVRALMNKGWSYEQSDQLVWLNQYQYKQGSFAKGTPIRTGISVCCDCGDAEVSHVSFDNARLFIYQHKGHSTIVFLHRPHNNI